MLAAARPRPPWPSSTSNRERFWSGIGCRARQKVPQSGLQMGAESVSHATHGRGESACCERRGVYYKSAGSPRSHHIELENVNVSVGTHSHLFIIVSLIAVFAMHTPSSPSLRYIKSRTRAFETPFIEGFLLPDALAGKGNHMYQNIMMSALTYAC